NGHTTDTVNVGPAGTTTYTVAVTKNGCTKDTSITVHVKLPIPVNITPNPDKVCKGTQVTLTANAPGASTYKWSNGATTSSITFNADSSGIYSVVVSNGCPDSASSAVIVVTPNLNLCCDTTISLGDSAYISASGDTAYSWSPDPSSLSCY